MNQYKHFDVLVSDGGIVQLYDERREREIREYCAEQARLYRALCLSLAVNAVLLAACAVVLAVRV
jgi:hypothetical protein